MCYTFFKKYDIVEKGKLSVRMGRKAIGSCAVTAQDSLATNKEKVSSYERMRFFLFSTQDLRYEFTAKARKGQMKKNGFSTAELLVTMAIASVVFGVVIIANRIGIDASTMGSNLVQLR